MEKAKIRVNEGVVISDNFDDIYFDSKNGMEETKHVFIDRNNLPDAFKDKESYTIIETGFGTGLNFLTLLSEYEKSGSKTALNFFSVEKYPIDRKRLLKVLDFWNLPFKEQLIENYPENKGMHRISFGDKVALNLFVGDIKEFLVFINKEKNVNAWFLDGFAPDRNPEMWCSCLFETMGKITAKGGTFASYTAAGIVKQGLRKNGFFVKRYPGYGSKRHMIAGYRE